MRRSGDDRGVALPIVMVLGLVMAMLVGTSLTAVSSGLTVADRTQDSTGALDAAYAGVQEYSARLSADSTYQTYGNSLSTFTIASHSTVTASTTNPAFGVGANGTWATVPGSSGTAAYRYEVDNSGYATTGLVNIRSTGRVGTVARSLVAQLRQTGFTNYLYFTDYEALDPLISGRQDCVAHIWDPAHPDSCQVIQFGPNDTIQGPAHSNDTLTICGTTFRGAVTSSSPETPIASTPDNCTSTATYAVGGGVTYSPTLAMPPSNSTMQVFAASSGCLYTGPTQITYNSDGTMTVRSPWTKQTEPSNSTSTTPPKCGAPKELQSTAGATVSVLSNSLLFVQDVPTDSSNPNYTSTSKANWPANFTCLDSSGSNAAADSASSAGWKFGTVQYPRANEVPPSPASSVTSFSTSPPAYGCRSGDLYVSGMVQGVTTAAASNYVYVVGDLKYSSRTTDVLGLVGNSAVLVWNPMSATVTTKNQQTTVTYSPILTDSGREIDAAILSVQHTFQVQNYDRGTARGTLTVFGSIAQKFRGVVASALVSSNGTITSTTGYFTKNYQYDSRLASVVPPYFLAPASVIFTLSRVAQVPTAFTSTGATP